MKFEDALRVLKSGDQIARVGWNGKGMSLKLIREWGGLGVTGKALPFIVMRIVDGSYVPWLASQTDILAADWVNVSAGGITEVSASEVKEAGGLRAAVEKMSAEAARGPVAIDGPRVTTEPVSPHLPHGTAYEKAMLLVDLNGRKWWIDPTARRAELLP